jgi:RNA polymerase sigma-70 factor (ECF subfamily)
MERFEILVERHHDEIYAYLWRLLGEEGADDATQEVFLRAFRAYGRLTHGDYLRAWLYKIATNVAYTFLSRRKRNTQQQIDLPDEHPALASMETGPDGQIERGDTLAEIRREIAALPPRQQMALVLRYLNEQSYEEIASTMDCSPETARANVYQAVRRLRRVMAGQGGAS